MSLGSLLRNDFLSPNDVAMKDRTIIKGVLCVNSELQGIDEIMAFEAGIMTETSEGYCDNVRPGQREVLIIEGISVVSYLIICFSGHTCQVLSY